MRLFLMLFLAFSFIFLPPAHAGLQTSEEEKAVFSFFRLAGATPDYTTWINHSQRYLKAPDALKQSVYDEEETRLKWGFGTFDPGRDFLKIETDIELHVTNGAEGLGIAFSFPGKSKDEPVYFPYSYGQEWIALVVDDLEKFSKIPLMDEDSAYLTQKLGRGGNFKARLKMRIRPLSADTDAPLALTEKDKFWLLRGDIAYLAFEKIPKNEIEEQAKKTLEEERKTAIFSYTAPWYLSDTESELLNLLGE